METLHSPTDRLRDHFPERLVTENPSVVARQLTQDDDAWLLDLANDPAVERFIPWAPKVNTIENAQKLVEHWLASNGARFIIEHDGAACGFFNVWPDPDMPDLLLSGSALMPDYRGQDIVNTVFRAVEPVLEEYSGKAGMTTLVDETNASSQRMIMKRGYTATDEVNAQNKRRYIKYFTD